MTDTQALIGLLAALALVPVVIVGDAEAGA